MSAVESILYKSIQIWLDSLTSKGGQCRRQSSTSIFKYGWIHLQTAIVKEDYVNRQSSYYIWFRFSYILIVKEDSVSYQSSVDLFRIHLHSTIGKSGLAANLV